VFEGSRSSTKRHKALTYDSLKEIQRETPQIDKSSDKRKFQEKAPKIREIEKQEDQQEHLRNHAKPSIHTVKDSYKV
jgi:hypothetical protein